MWCGNSRSHLSSARVRNDWSGTSNPPSDFKACIYTDVYAYSCQDFNTATNLETEYRNTGKRNVMESTVC
jgi:hypothetical protein